MWDQNSYQYFQNRYASRGNRHMLALVNSGVKFTKTTVNPQVAQLLESRKFSIFEVCLMVGVPPTVLGDLTSGTFSNTEQQQLALGTNTLHPVAECWRQELDLKLTPMAREGEEYEYNYDKALKRLDAADTAAKTQSLHTAVGGPWMSVTEARQEDGLPEEVNGTIYPPPNMNAAPGQGEPASGEPASGEPAASAAGEKTEGPDGKPTTEDLQSGSTEPTTEDAKAAKTAGPSVPSLSRILAFAARSSSATPWSSSIAPVFLDAGQRMAAKEAAAIGGYAKHLREGHPEQFEKRASDFYARHAEHVAQAFEPGLTALRSQVADAVRAEFRDGHHVRMVGGGDFQLSDDAAAGAYAKKLGDAHVAAGKAALTALMTGMQEPNAVADAIEARCQGLASAIAEGMPHQVRQASNYFARAAYRAAGCTQLRWVADPACTEECRALDGQVVAIDQPFASDPPRHHPPLKEGCRCQVSGVREEKGAARQAPSFRPAVERRDAADGGRWITINGAAVHINAEGMIDKGPKLLVNKHHQDLKATIGEDPHGDLRDQAVDKFAAFLCPRQGTAGKPQGAVSGGGRSRDCGHGPGGPGRVAQHDGHDPLLRLDQGPRRPSQGDRRSRQAPRGGRRAHYGTVEPRKGTIRGHASHQRRQRAAQDKSQGQGSGGLLRPRVCTLGGPEPKLQPQAGVARGMEGRGRQGHGHNAGEREPRAQRRFQRLRRTRLALPGVGQARHAPMLVALARLEAGMIALIAVPQLIPIEHLVVGGMHEDSGGRLDHVGAQKAVPCGQFLGELGNPRDVLNPSLPPTPVYPGRQARSKKSLTEKWLTEKSRPGPARSWRSCSSITCRAGVPVEVTAFGRVLSIDKVSLTILSWVLANPKTETNPADANNVSFTILRLTVKSLEVLKPQKTRSHAKPQRR